MHVYDNTTEPLRIYRKHRDVEMIYLQYRSTVYPLISLICQRLIILFFTFRTVNGGNNTIYKSYLTGYTTQRSN